MGTRRQPSVLFGEEPSLGGQKECRFVEIYPLGGQEGFLPLALGVPGCQAAYVGMHVQHHSNAVTL